MTEPTGGSDLANLQTRAVPKEDGSWVLNGEKRFISLALTADRALVLARTGNGLANLTFFAVPQGPDGYVVTRELIKHGTHSVETCELELREVIVGPECVVGRVGAGLVLFSRAMTAERLALCAQLVGAFEASLEISRAYLRRRRTGNGRLWDLQALRHRYADLLAEWQA